MSVSGSTLASASTMQSPCRHWRNSRNMRSISNCSFGFRTFGPLVEMMKGTASIRNPETPRLDPKAHDFKYLSLDFGIRRIEIRLEIVKSVEVPRFRFAIVVPGCFLDAGKHHPFVRVRRFLLRPDVPVPIFRIWIRTRLLEPRMLVGGVVHYQIDQNTNATLFCAVGKLDEIPERTVARIDIVIVSDVVTIVPARRGLKRHQPNRGHAQSMHIIEAAH